MKTLAGWIAGVLGVGIVLGSLVAGLATSEARNPTELENALSRASLVDCGEGRKAVLEPAIENGQTLARVTCVALEPESRPAPAAPPTRTVVREVPVVPAAPVQVVSRQEPAPRAPVGRDTQDRRSWKDSALIIGSSAGAGAGIGALAKGGKGALVGAAIGGAAGTVYDLTTRNKNK